MNFFVLFLVIYSDVGMPINSTNNNERITSGFDAYPGQFPYQALVRPSDHLQYLCGGSIINKQWILTSAGCIKLLEPTNKMRIVVGSIYLNRGGTTHTVLISFKHPAYDKDVTNINDIGLIRVNGLISFNDFVRPIQLFSDSIMFGLPLTITGWGVTNNSVIASIPNTLQYGTVQSMTLCECKKLYPVPLFNTQLCTHSSNSQNLCTFDNGGPLVYNGHQHALVSITGGCHISIPDVHTRIAPFQAWIKNITNII